MKMIIGGQQVDSSDNKTIDVLNPATNTCIDTVPAATRDDIESALEHAQEGKAVWAATPLHQRATILLRVADAIQKKKKELAVLLSSETGKILREAEGEFDVATGLFRGYVERANHLYGLTMPDSQPGAERDIILTRREPLGSIVCILPFNFPIDLFAHKVAPALAAGNAVIVKPPDKPLAVIRMTELLLECGVPGNVLQVVTGLGSAVGNWLVSSPKIEAVSLTGSTKVGMSVATETAKNLRRSFLELGGNDAMIVFDDADLDLAVQEAVQSRMLNAGQTCCAAKRFLVHHSVKDTFTEKLVAALKTLSIGDPLAEETDVGCLINEQAALAVEEKVAQTLKQGATCILGGTRFNRTFFEPTVIVDVTPAMDISKDMEIFGPVFPIIGFDSIEEALEIANASQYGLMGGVLTRDINKAMHIAARMECGGVVVNGSGTYRTMEMPFGGYKMSGIGREGISYTLEEMTQLKTIVLKKVL